MTTKGVITTRKYKNTYLYIYDRNRKYGVMYTLNGRTDTEM